MNKNVGWMCAVAGFGLLATVGGAQAQYGGQVSGSYTQTCRNIEQQGSYVRALCRDASGRFVPAQIDASRCGSVGNRNGRLECESAGERERVRPRNEDRGYDDRRGRDDRRGGYGDRDDRRGYDDRRPY